jgi:hypothetical protein
MLGIKASEPDQPDKEDGDDKILVMRMKRPLTASENNLCAEKD